MGTGIWTRPLCLYLEGILSGKMEIDKIRSWPRKCEENKLANKSKIGAEYEGNGKGGLSRG